MFKKRMTEQNAQKMLIQNKNEYQQPTNDKRNTNEKLPLFFINNSLGVDSSLPT